jgi:hypothetical protein
MGHRLFDVNRIGTRGLPGSALNFWFFDGGYDLSLPQAACNSSTVVFVSLSHGSDTLRAYWADSRPALNSIYKPDRCEGKVWLQISLPTTMRRNA